jgi:alpha-beta hydrolase superfamily lysophospholipase
MIAGGPSVKKNEEAINAADGTALHAWRLAPAEPRGGVLILHGYGDHSGRYTGLVEHLAGRGYACFLLDLRGHGRSGGRRGAVMSWDEYLGDLELFIQRAEAWHGGPVRTLLGHSMGGLLAASYVLRRGGGFRDLVMLSPLLGLAVQAPPLKAALGKLMSRILPRLSLPTEIKPEVLSHDPATARDYARDPLVHRVVNCRWYTEALAAMDYCLAHAGELPVERLLLMHGTGDQLASAQASREFFQKVRLADRTADFPEGMFHELLNEVGRQGFYSRIGDWIERGGD